MWIILKFTFLWQKFSKIENKIFQKKKKIFNLNNLFFEQIKQNIKK